MPISLAFLPGGGPPPRPPPPSARAFKTPRGWPKKPPSPPGFYPFFSPPFPSPWKFFFQPFWFRVFPQKSFPPFPPPKLFLPAPLVFRLPPLPVGFPRPPPGLSNRPQKTPPGRSPNPAPRPSAPPLGQTPPFFLPFSPRFPPVLFPPFPLPGGPPLAPLFPPRRRPFYFGGVPGLETPWPPGFGPPGPPRVFFFIWPKNATAPKGGPAPPRGSRPLFPGPFRNFF